MPETQWIDWFPKVGDIKPEGYRFRSVSEDNRHPWKPGTYAGRKVQVDEIVYNEYQIPAPVVTPAEDRPPWIDPQCKFRWGDRVKDKKGNIWFVNHPNDGLRFPVVCTKERNYLHPYIEWSAEFIGDSAVEVFDEEDLELFPEDLPKHFDDRILDADQPQESVNQQPARVPREIWVSTFADGNCEVSWGNCPMYNQFVEVTHFREVLPDDLTNLQYSPGG